jgi:hypothetical protein
MPARRGRKCKILNINYYVPQFNHNLAQPH